jgi:hypothetical protein
MSRNAQAVLTAFDELPPAAREEVVSELLRRVAQSEHAPLSDDELVAAADQVFVDLDRRENSQR